MCCTKARDCHKNIIKVGGDYKTVINVPRSNFLKFKNITLYLPLFSLKEGKVSESNDVCYKR